MRAGTLNTRITLQQQTTAADAAGQPLDVWDTVAIVWADLRHLSGVAAIKADSQTSIVKASARIHWRTGLAAGMRAVLASGTTYTITAVLPDEARRVHVDLVLELRT